MVGVGAQNVIVSAWINYGKSPSGASMSSSQPTSCSSFNSQSDTVNAMLQSMCSSQPKVAGLSQTVTYADGSTATLIINAAPGLNIGDSPSLCGEPTIPTTQAALASS